MNKTFLTTVAAVFVAQWLYANFGSKLPTL